MTKIVQPQFEEKRFASRVVFRLPVVVSGKSADGTAWSEPTETEDMSTTGVLLRLNRKVSEDENISIRSHRSDGVLVEVTAKVLRTSKTSQRMGIVGAAVTEPTEDWLRFFTSWVTDNQLEN